MLVRDDKMQSEDEHALDPDDATASDGGIYILMEAGEAIYIGQSVNMQRRVRSHKTNGRKFDEVRYIECEHDKDLLEQALIKHLRPRDNLTHQPRDDFAFIAKAAPKNKACAPSGAPVQQVRREASNLYRTLSEPEAATYVGLSRRTLQALRVRGDGPLYLQLSERRVGYTIEHLEQWKAMRVVKSTSMSSVLQMVQVKSRGVRVDVPVKPRETRMGRGSNARLLKTLVSGLA